MMRVFASAVLISVGGLLVLPTASRAQEAPPLLWNLQFEQLEYRFGEDTDQLAWESDVGIGNDDWRLRLTTEGAYALQEHAFETLQGSLFVERRISSFFNAKAGMRYSDSGDAPARASAVVGLHGLGPQWFEIDADAFVSQTGDVSLGLEVEYEALITNRLILTPSLEVDFGFTDDATAGLGQGFRTLEVGARLSYDVLDRSIAPYIGVHYERRFGETASLARREGEGVDELFFVAGVRLMY